MAQEQTWQAALARITEELARKDAEADRLLAISGSFTFSMDQDGIMIAVLQEVSEEDIDRCTIALYEAVEDRDPEWIELLARYDREAGEMGLIEPRRLKLDEIPLAHELLRSREVLICPTPQEDPRLRPGLLDEIRAYDTQTMAAVPLMRMGWPLGFLLIESRTPRSFTPEELRFYQIVANLAAMALWAAWLLEERDRRIGALAMLNRISSALGSTLEMDQLIELLYDQLCHSLHLQDFYIALYEEEQDRITFPLAVEHGKRQTWLPRERGNGLTEYIIRTRSSLLLPDRVGERIKQLGLDVIGELAKSWMGTPMLIANKPIGVIAAQDFRQEHAFSEEDLDLLSTIANQAAVALENARHFEALRRQTVRLRLAAEVGRRLLSITDLDQLLTEVTDLICDSFGYYHVHLDLLDPSKTKLIYRSGSGEAGHTMREEGRELALGEGIIGWVAQHREPLVVNDVSRDPRFKPHLLLPETHAELAVPVQVGNDLLGVLDVQAKHTGAFHPDDVAMFESLADQIAVALQRAQLYQQLQDLQA